MCCLRSTTNRVWFLFEDSIIAAQGALIERVEMSARKERIMSEIAGYVSGNAIIAEQDLQQFDGCRVRIEIMDKKTAEVERLFGLWKDHGDELSPGESVRLLRKGRAF